MDFSIDRLNRQSPFSEEGVHLTLEGIESSGYLTYQPDTVAELNIKRSYDDLLDVSTTYLGPDLIQSNHVFNAEASFPITLDCHTDGELLGGRKIRYPATYRCIQKLYVQSILYVNTLICISSQNSSQL